MKNDGNNIPLDDIAVRLAASDGQAWSEMSDFPGYARNRWRDEARSRVLRDRPGARIECLPPTWDGRDGMCFVVTS